MINLITFTVKIILTLYLMISYNICGLASLITWDIKYLDICEDALKKIWLKQANVLEMINKQRREKGQLTVPYANQ